jgi:hypothetical protein
MSQCKKCGGDVIWKEKPGGGFFPPENKDGSRHDCENKHGKAAPPQIVGRLDFYNSGSATFTVKGGKSKTYAILQSVSKDFELKGFHIPSENHPDVWLGFSVDDKSFILPGYAVVQKPDWASTISDPTNGEIKQPAFTRASELPKDTPCTSPAASPESPAPVSVEDKIRAAMAALPPSERVGYRISLAGMVNSVIEMERMSSDAPKDYANIEADVKEKALELFLWCDQLTTQNLKGVQ